MAIQVPNTYLDGQSVSTLSQIPSKQINLNYASGYPTALATLDAENGEAWTLVFPPSRGNYQLVKQEPVESTSAYVSLDSKVKQIQSGCGALVDTLGEWPATQIDEEYLDWDARFSIPNKATGSILVKLQFLGAVAPPRCPEDLEG